MKTIFSTFILLFISLICLSQISYEKRIETELKDGYFNEHITEFGELDYH